MSDLNKLLLDPFSVLTGAYNPVCVPMIWLLMWHIFNLHISVNFTLES